MDVPDAEQTPPLKGADILPADEATNTIQTHKKQTTTTTNTEKSNACVLHVKRPRAAAALRCRFLGINLPLVDQYRESPPTRLNIPLHNHYHRHSHNNSTRARKRKNPHPTTTTTKLVNNDNKYNERRKEKKKDTGRDW